MKPLNIFQRCIRVWEQSHPYNAAQILHLAGDADLERITTAWNETLAASGLGTARVAGRRFCYEPSPRQEIAVVRGDLEAFITRELNRPFDEEPANADPANGRTVGRNGHPGAARTMMPFRPFLLPGNGAHHLGIVYQHWVADSVSLRMLLREWFCRLYDPPRAAGRPLHVPHGGFWRYFGPGRGGWNLVEGVASILNSMSQFSSARKIAEENDEQRVTCSLHHLPEGLVEALLASARRRGVRLNDVLLAALARACDEHGAQPRRSHRDLALGTIVDLRAMSGEDLDNTFGLFLGFTTVMVRAEHLRDPDRLLAGIALQSAQQRESRAAQASMLRMAAGYTQAQFLSARRLAAFYRNYMPLSGGVSNVNMNRSWAAAYHPDPLLDYLRVAPTGPMVPLVIAATTIGRRFSFWLTRRASLVDDAHGAQLARTFLAELTLAANMG